MEVWHTLTVLSQTSSLFMYNEYRQDAPSDSVSGRWARYTGTVVREVGVQSLALYSPFKQQPLAYYSGSFFYPTPFRHIRNESADTYDMCRMGKWDFDIETRRIVVSEFNNRFGWEPFSKGVYQYKGFSIPNYERYALCDLPGLESFVRYTPVGSGVAYELRRYSSFEGGLGHLKKGFLLPRVSAGRVVTSWKARYGVYHGVGLPQITLKKLRRACLDAAQDFDLKAKAY